MEELLYQTKALRNIMKNFECCCCSLDVIFSTVERSQLELIVQFLYKGEIICNDQNIAKEIASNLQNFLGFPKKFIGDFKENFIKEETFDGDEPSIAISDTYENIDEFELIDNYYSDDFESELEPQIKIQGSQILI